MLSWHSSLRVEGINCFRDCVSVAVRWWSNHVFTYFFGSHFLNGGPFILRNIRLEQFATKMVDLISDTIIFMMEKSLSHSAELHGIVLADVIISVSLAGICFCDPISIHSRIPLMAFVSLTWNRLAIYLTSFSPYRMLGSIGHVEQSNTFRQSNKWTLSGAAEQSLLFMRSTKLWISLFRLMEIILLFELNETPWNVIDFDAHIASSTISLGVSLNELKALIVRLTFRSASVNVMFCLWSCKDKLEISFRTPYMRARSRKNSMLPSRKYNPLNLCRSLES